MNTMITQQINYEKSHNLLLHTIHYNLKKLNELYLDEKKQIFEQHQANAQGVSTYVDTPYDCKYAFNAPVKLAPNPEINDLFNILYPSLPIIRESFSQFTYLFDWIESKKTIDSINPESCWCLGCKGNRLIQFEERPSLGVAPAIVPLGNGTPPASDFKLVKDMPTHEEEKEQEKKAAFQKYLHDEVCSIKGAPCCNPCKDKNKEDNQIIKKLMQWANERFDYSDQVGFIFKELCDGYQTREVKLFYGEYNAHEMYNFNETITHGNINSVLVNHHDTAKWWFDRCKKEANENMARNNPTKPEGYITLGSMSAGL